MASSEGLRCGDCGADMALTHGDYGWYYACTKAPACRGIVSAHQHSLLPMGTPADAATRRARKIAHAAFDQLWWRSRDPFTGKNVRAPFGSRDAAYAWLREVMGKTSEEGHIGRFTLTECEALTALAREKARDFAARNKGG